MTIWCGASPAIPGVTAAGLNSAVPLEGGGAESPSSSKASRCRRRATPATMCLFQASTPGLPAERWGFRCVRGRAFSAWTTRRATPVVDRRRDARRAGCFRREIRSASASRSSSRQAIGQHPDAASGARSSASSRHVRHYGIASEPPFVQVYTPIEQLPLWFEQRRPVDGAVRAHVAPRRGADAAAIRTRDRRRSIPTCRSTACRR